MITSKKHRFGVSRAVWLQYALGISLFAPMPARSDLIATFETGGGGGWPFAFDWMTHEAFLSKDFGADEGLGTLFEDIVIHEGENISHTVTAETDSDFAQFTELITDGVDWWLYDKYNFAGGLYGWRSGFGLESQRLDFTDPDHSGPDLSGYVIESITRILSVEFDSPGSDPNGDGQWTDYQYSGVFEIHGHPIPEPTAFGLLLFGAGVAFRQRRGVD